MHASATSSSVGRSSFAGTASVSAGLSLLVVMLLPEVHSSNRVLDALPATASVARDIAIALLGLVALPLVVVVGIVFGGAAILAAGRAVQRARPASTALPARVQPIYRPVTPRP